MVAESLYQVLEIDPSSNAEQIKAAFRTLAKKYHPDKNKGNKEAEEKFKTVSDAYSILSDPKARAEYDKNRHTSTMQSATVEDAINWFFNRGASAHSEYPTVDELANALE